MFPIAWIQAGAGGGRGVERGARVLCRVEPLIFVGPTYANNPSSLRSDNELPTFFFIQRLGIAHQHMLDTVQYKVSHGGSDK